MIQSAAQPLDPNGTYYFPIFVDKDGNRFLLKDATLTFASEADVIALNSQENIDDLHADIIIALTVVVARTPFTLAKEVHMMSFDKGNHTHTPAFSVKLFGIPMALLGGPKYDALIAALPTDRGAKDKFKVQLLDGEVVDVEKV